MDTYYEISAIPKSVIDKKLHLMRWANGTFSERLKSKGFVSYQGEGLSWYKVVNNDVLLTVYIHAFSSVVPMVPAIGYGIHPLFIEAPIPQKVVVRGWIDNEVMSRLYFPGSKKQYDKDTFVLCPPTPLLGAEVLEEKLFPLFDSICSIKDAYIFHKERYLDYASRNGLDLFSADNEVITTNDFVDIAIYMNDTGLFNRCLNDIVLKEGWSPKEQPRMNAQRIAIMDNARDEYLLQLAKRKQKFAHKLNQKLGVDI